MLLIGCNKDLRINSWGRKYEGGTSKQRDECRRKADIAESKANKERNRHGLEQSREGKN